MSTNGLSSPTRSLKTRFARRFLQTLIRMKRNRPTSSSSLKNIHGRSQVIKIASYSSMARVVGSKRAWSRAFIFKIRSRRVRHQGLVKRRCRRYGVSSKRVVVLRRSSQRSIIVKKKKAVGEKTPPSSREPSQFDKLRVLIPGGDKMDLCNLLEETAHYIKCLGTQVKVMEKMADDLSSST